MNITLITGASGGIGQAAALLAARDGREPLCVGRSQDKLAACLPGLRHLQADVTDHRQVVSLFEQLDAEDNVPDALIHTVGSTLVGSLERVTAAQYLDTINVNLTSAVATSQQFIALLKKRRMPGSIVLFSSVVARIGVANHEIIAAAKAGIEGFALAAAASVASAGIRVNVIAPGLTETPMTRHLLANDSARAAATRQYPIAGVNSAEDVAELACWLTSPKAARITGQVIAVDGGFSAIRPLVRG